MKRFISAIALITAILILGVSCDLEGTTLLSDVPGWLRGQTIDINGFETEAVDGQRYLTRVRFSANGENMTFTYTVKGTGNTVTYGFVDACRELPNCDYGGSGSPSGSNSWNILAVYPGDRGSTIYSTLTFSRDPDTGLISARCSQSHEYSFALLPVKE